MAQTSKKPLDKETKDRLFGTFSSFFGTALRKLDAETVLSEFFTPTEKIYLIKRLMVSYFLIKEVDWITIRGVLGVSLSTINSVAHRLESGEQKLKKEMEEYYSKTDKGKEAASFLEELFLAGNRGMNAGQIRLHRLEHKNS
ncbi:MAG: hypothetical protein ABH814_00305 [bacterium]